MLLVLREMSIFDRTIISSSSDESDPRIISAYPTLRAAAEILGVNASMLSRLPNLETEARGSQRRLSPRVMIELARFYRRRAIGEIASDLLDYAYDHAPDYATQIDEAIEVAIGPTTSALDARGFLAEAKRALPTALYAEVKRVYASSGGREPINSRRTHAMSSQGSVHHRG